MKNPNICRRIMFCMIIGGIVLAGIAGIIWGVEPVHPLFIVGVVIAFGGIIYGMITVRCPFCHRMLHLKGLNSDEYCPYCGEKIHNE